MVNFFFFWAPNIVTISISKVLTFFKNMFISDVTDLTNVTCLTQPVDFLSAVHGVADRIIWREIALFTFHLSSVS